ncbi:DUF2200 family protein [Streptobacillus canis]|uniref:DUF2200 family protein n=1 Tax=Streptobacillus canis TaxID=2678686 RepID=UPI0012E28629|nr:DUF2200 family protein [Streptobacillus canis]
MGHKIYEMPFSKVYPLLKAKLNRKNIDENKVDLAITWLTGYNKREISKIVENKIGYKEFFKKAPKLNEDRFLVTGSICGVRITEIEEELMKEIRILDKVIDELSKGKDIDKIIKKEGK